MIATDSRKRPLALSNGRITKDEMPAPANAAAMAPYVFGH